MIFGKMDFLKVRGFDFGVMNEKYEIFIFRNYLSHSVVIRLVISSRCRRQEDICLAPLIESTRD